jgi:hypothetical protein
MIATDRAVMPTKQSQSKSGSEHRANLMSLADANTRPPRVELGQYLTAILWECQSYFTTRKPGRSCVVRNRRASGRFPE